MSDEFMRRERLVHKDEFMRRERLVHKVVAAMQNHQGGHRYQGPTLILRDKADMGVAFALVAKKNLERPMHFDWAGGVAVIATVSNEEHSKFHNLIKQVVLGL